MTSTPPLTFTGTVLDAPDAREPAGFYRRLLGWTVTADEPDRVKLEPPGGGPGLAFQTEPHYKKPVWPPEPSAPGMMTHLDIEAPELAAAEAHARACGAVRAAFQPQDGVRMYLDPAGHPFCLWTRG
ncbi:VOC family protein [Streptomyces sp. NPDC000229]|uniref:VOC family protein n=1 Tax=Streptomyces sp. NPDC000229 TaxID=3154247 RepID=UPI003322B999